MEPGRTLREIFRIKDKSGQSQVGEEVGLEKRENIKSLSLKMKE